MFRLLKTAFVIYIVGYAVLRTLNAEVWAKDGQTYVIFPEDPPELYMIYRPLAYLDNRLTGMQFHIGPHR